MNPPRAFPDDICAPEDDPEAQEPLMAGQAQAQADRDHRAQRDQARHFDRPYIPVWPPRPPPRWGGQRPRPDDDLFAREAPVQQPGVFAAEIRGDNK